MIALILHDLASACPLVFAAGEQWGWRGFVTVVAGIAGLDWIMWG